MKLLLDTHIILWSVSSPDKLLPHVLDELKKESNELWFSPISAWEIFLLAEKGRITLKPSFSKCIQDIIKELSLTEHRLTLMWQSKAVK